MRAETRMRLTKALTPELKLSLGMWAETRRFGTTPGLTKTKALTLELNYTPLGEGADGAVCGRRHATDLALRAPPQQGGFFLKTLQVLSLLAFFRSLDKY